MILTLHPPCIGAETADCLRHLAASNPEIKQFCFAAITRPTPLQERFNLCPSEAKIVDDALQTRAETHLPFWDALHLMSFGSGNVSERLLAQARFHQSNVDKEEWLDASRVVDGELSQRCLDHVGPTMLSVLSEVKLKNGSRGHFVFIDFHIPVSPENAGIVSKVANQLLSYPAFIIESGASYHLIGTEVVDAAEFRRALITALLFGPITDRAYIAHQLLEGKAALRYSKGGHFDMIPKLVRISSPLPG